MWNPWNTLRSLEHVSVHWSRPHPRVPAATDGDLRIWIDPRANQVERRCLLAHELVHLELKHRGCQPPAVERAVRAEVAHRLIHLDSLIRHLPWSRGRFELAEELWVTELVLDDRLSTLTLAEHHVLASLDYPAP